MAINTKLKTQDLSDLNTYITVRNNDGIPEEYKDETYGLYEKLKSNGYSTDIYVKNLGTLKIFTENIGKGVSYKGFLLDAMYNLDNTITLFIDDINTFRHELLHCASTSVENGLYHAGLSYTNDFGAKCDYLTEGLTELLVANLYKIDVEKMVGPYMKFMLYSSFVNLMAGNQTMEKAYFIADFKEAYKKLCSSIGEADAKRFFSLLEDSVDYDIQGKRGSTISFLKASLIVYRYLLEKSKTDKEKDNYDIFVEFSLNGSKNPIKKRIYMNAAKRVRKDVEKGNRRYIDKKED